jgi:hypothetical protein
MKTIAFLFGACGLLVLPVGAAAAGPCTTEIDSLTKLMAARDAGAGPTAGAAGTTSSDCGHGRRGSEYGGVLHRSAIGPLAASADRGNE